MELEYKQLKRIISLIESGARERDIAEEIGIPRTTLKRKMDELGIQTIHKEKRHPKQLVTCKKCEKEFYKVYAEVIKHPNHFCSHSCAAIYRNTHKTHGTRRSKLEVYIENKIKEDFPYLNCLYNNKEIIKSELDFYFPDLKLAIELNGIFHYEPIFGDKKFNKIQENDKNKFQKCIELGISLCIIDSSSLTYFKEEKAILFYNIIKEHIEIHLNKKADN